MEIINYPLKFAPIFKEKIWGGDKLNRLLHKACPGENVGESWEISGVKDEVSTVANGPLKGKKLDEVLHQYGERLVGRKIYQRFPNQFPLLIKFIDAKENLSVQLHPNDELSAKRHNSFGKNEMWFIVQADEKAEINIGFKKDVLKEEYFKALEEQKITDLLHFERVKKGDSFMINTGKVHAIGKGVLLAEIQQTSDVTYRIYDWDREDNQGNRRELHTELALEAIDFLQKDDFKLEYEKKENRASQIVHNSYFTTNYFPVKGKVTREYEGLDSFVIYMCVGGRAEIAMGENVEPLATGETLLVPASAKEVVVTSEGAELLEIYIK